MKTRLLILAACLALPVVAHAGADCAAHPKDQWMKQEDLKAKLTAAGYKIKKFKVDGNCYEMYGHNDKGQRVEIYMDTVTGEPVKTHVK
jgi:hypothetical protein